ncbi:MAG: hypothetical protein JO101_06320, partial [Candidatus Eremiobacteraeota bacterium]|nr:hypothetical protein [Candidatus Eremiobacteraeota bacterium]
LTRDSRRRVADLFIGVSRRDPDRVTDAIVALAAPDHPIDRSALSDELNRLLEDYVAVSFEKIPFGRAIGQLLEVVRAQGLRFPGSVALLFKTLIMCEGLLLALDPHANLADQVEPLVRRLLYGGFGENGWRERISDSAAEAAEFAAELPRRVDRVLGQIERGNIRVWTQIDGLDKTVDRFEHAVERANASMLASACIVGLAILMLVYQPPGWQRWIGTAFWVGVTVAVLIALRTAWRNLKKERDGP